MPRPLPLGTETPLGRVAAIFYAQPRERYYVLSKDGVACVRPAADIEPPDADPAETPAKD